MVRIAEKSIFFNSGVILVNWNAVNQSFKMVNRPQMRFEVQSPPKMGFWGLKGLKNANCLVLLEIPQPEPPLDGIFLPLGK